MLKEAVAQTIGQAGSEPLTEVKGRAPSSRRAAAHLRPRRKNLSFTASVLTT